MGENCADGQGKFPCLSVPLCGMVVHGGREQGNFVRYHGKNLCMSLCLMIGLLLPLRGEQLPLLLQERYLLAQVESEHEELSIGYNVFNGDFPLLLHARPDELSVYLGSPLFFPAYFSVGTTSQVGYYDAYRTYTPLSLLAIGWRYDLMQSKMMTHPGLFFSWGWRAGNLSGALAYHSASREAEIYLGASFDRIGVTAAFSTDHLIASISVRSKASWTIQAAVEAHASGPPKFSLGFGFSRRDYPSQSIRNERWKIEVAHRGSLELAPENSLEAFAIALEEPGYIAIETDIQMTADGNFVLVHDPILFRYRHGFELVKELTTDELKSLDMGSWFDREFAGARMMELSELAELANENPDVYWLLELKVPIWDEQDARRFLAEIDRLFIHPERVAFYAISREMMVLMQRLTGRPVGLQLDSLKSMLFYSDHVLPLMKSEYRPLIEGADFFTILSSKYDRQELLIELSEELGIPVMLWNFHDVITGYVPVSKRRYPLGMQKMADGKVLL